MNFHLKLNPQNAFLRKCSGKLWFFTVLPKNGFSEKYELCQLLDFEIIYYHAMKTKKKLISSCREKLLTDRERRRDIQQ